MILLIHSCLMHLLSIANLILFPFSYFIKPQFKQINTFALSQVENHSIQVNLF